MTITCADCGATQRIVHDVIRAAVGEAVTPPDNIDKTGRMGILAWNSSCSHVNRPRKWNGYSWDYSEAEEEG